MMADHSSREPSPADRIHESHDVIGTDEQGRIHHYVRDWGREYITEDGGAVFVVDPDEGLDGAYALEDKSLSDWVAQVEVHVGWEECHVVATAPVFEELTDTLGCNGGGL